MIDVRKLVLSRAAAGFGRLAQNATIKKILFNALRLNRLEIHKLLMDDDVRFISYCLARRDCSRSQIMQDLWVCFELGEKAGGYFVEFGATNGIKNSNTWFLEKKLGWQGILAEPNPIWHHDLAINRTAFIEHRCISSKSDNIVAFITTNNTDPELSAIASFSKGDHFAETRSQGNHIQIETISLDDLLNKYKAPLLIDYISIDTEGSELEILSTYSFNHKFKTISIESNPKNEKEIHDLLSSKGYKRVFKQFSQWDSWYVSAELRDGGRPTIIAPDL